MENPKIEINLVEIYFMIWTLWTHDTEYAKQIHIIVVDMHTYSALSHSI